MTNKQMKQLLPVLDSITGWGDLSNLEIEIVSSYGGEVIEFVIDKPDSEEYGIGFQLTVTRVRGSGKLWVMRHDLGGEFHLINANIGE